MQLDVVSSPLPGTEVRTQNNAVFILEIQVLQSAQTQMQLNVVSSPLPSTEVRNLP